MNASFQIDARYQILAPLGTGGMGTVYRARDQVLGRDVALKVLHPTLWQDVDGRHRFDREARALAGIVHPNVIRILATPGESETTPYLVMELAEGPSLEVLIQQHGRLPFEVALVLMAEILGGLDAMHQVGIMHRDLKPSNILFSLDGCPCIADLGLARRLDETSITVTGTALGTLRYLPPEAFDNEKPTRSWDTWAMGNILYEMVCGQPPFDMESASSLILQVIQVNYVRARERVKNLDPAVDALIQGALRHPASERHADAASFRREVLGLCLEHGLTDPAAIFRAWFSGRASPDGEQHLRLRTIERLVARAGSHQAAGEDLELLAIAERLLALDPAHPRLEQWLAGRPAPDPASPEPEAVMPAAAPGSGVISITTPADAPATGATRPIPIALPPEPAPPLGGPASLLLVHLATASLFVLMLAGDATDPPVRLLALPLLLPAAALVRLRMQPTALNYGLAAGTMLGAVFCILINVGRLLNSLAFYALVSPRAVAACTAILGVTSVYWSVRILAGRGTWSRPALWGAALAGPVLMTLGGPIQSTSRSVRLARELASFPPAGSAAPQKGIHHASALAPDGEVSYFRIPWTPAEIHRFYAARGVRHFSLFFGWDLDAPGGAAASVSADPELHELAGSLAGDGPELLLSPNSLNCRSSRTRIRPSDFWRDFHQVAREWIGSLRPRRLGLPADEEQGWARWVALEDPGDLEEWRGACVTVTGELRREFPGTSLGIVQLLDPVRRDGHGEHERMLRWAGMEGPGWIGLMLVAAELDVPTLDRTLEELRRRGPDKDLVLFTRTGGLGVRRLPFEEAVDTTWVEYLGRYARSRGYAAWYHRPNDSFLVYSSPWIRSVGPIPGTAPFNRFLGLYADTEGAR